MSKIYVIAGLVVTVALIAGCSNNSSSSEDNTIAFEPCEEGAELECGAFDVPLIHDSTDSRQTSINVARLPGTGDGPHEPLVFNLDGTYSGIKVLRELIQDNKIPFSIREQYDIIGFDQRGVSAPLQVDCDQLGDAKSVLYPTGQADVMTLAADFTMLADACTAKYSDQLQWVGSNAVVQDMEVMRSMLNVPKLNIVGASFGSRTSALYLAQYPDRSGRIVLDAPLRPTGKINSLLLDTVAAQQASFEFMLSACGTDLPDCDPIEAEEAFVARINSLLIEEDMDTFNAFLNLLLTGIHEIGLGQLLAPVLIDYAFNGDPTEMFAVIKDYGLSAEVQAGDESEGLTLERAVQCADDDARPTVESLIAELESLNETSDLFAEAILPLAASCVGWPEALDPVSDIRATDSPASLIIGGMADVNTPISWAAETAEAIGGVFIESGHLGHATLFVRDNECVNSIFLAYLLEGILPSEGTSCI